MSKIHAPIRDIVDFPLTFDTDVPIKAGALISLDFVNKTNDCIMFPDHYGLKILVYDRGEWLEIPEALPSPSQQNNVLERTGSKGDEGFLFVQPDFSALPLSRSIRAMRLVVIGDPCVNGVSGGEEVADFTELQVEP